MGHTPPPPPPAPPPPLWDIDRFCSYCGRLAAKDAIETCASCGAAHWTRKPFGAGLQREPPPRLIPAPLEWQPPRMDFGIGLVLGIGIGILSHHFGHGWRFLSWFQ